MTTDPATPSGVEPAAPWSDRDMARLLDEAAWTLEKEGWPLTAEPVKEAARRYAQKAAQPAAPVSEARAKLLAEVASGEFEQNTADLIRAALAEPVGEAHACTCPPQSILSDGPSIDCPEHGQPVSEARGTDQPSDWDLWEIYKSNGPHRSPEKPADSRLRAVFDAGAKWAGRAAGREGQGR